MNVGSQGFVAVLIMFAYGYYFAYFIKNIHRLLPMLGVALFAAHSLVAIFIVNHLISVLSVSIEPKIAVSLALGFFFRFLRYDG